MNVCNIKEHVHSHTYESGLLCGGFADHTGWFNRRGAPVRVPLSIGADMLAIEGVC